MNIEYESHEIITVDKMKSKKPSFPCIIVQVWYKKDGCSKKGYVEMPISLKSIKSYVTNDSRHQYLEDEIGLIVKAGKYFLEDLISTNEGDSYARH